MGSLIGSRRWPKSACEKDAVGKGIGFYGREIQEEDVEGAVADAKKEKNIGLLWTFGDIVKNDYYYLTTTGIDFGSGKWSP